MIGIAPAAESEPTESNSGRRAAATPSSTAARNSPRRGPIHRIEQPGYRPFLAVIGHDAVLDIERRPDEFTNEPIPILGSDEQLAMRAGAPARSARSSTWTSPT